MKKILFCALMAVTALSSCGINSNAKSGHDGNDTTLCQFSNIKHNKMYSYCDEEGDTTYFENTFIAFWPEVINGKSCAQLQQALFRQLTDSAELNQLDLVIDYLLNPANDPDFDSQRFTQVNAVKDDYGLLSTSEVIVTMQDMTDRLVTYQLKSSSYMAGAAHGLYANNFVTYDLKREKAVALSDIIADTTLLRNLTLQAIKQEYSYSKDDLFIPDNGLLPLPSDFHIDGMVLHVVYQIYEIASYAQGMIDAPIYPYMLKPGEKERLFTPYGLELLEFVE